MFVGRKLKAPPIRNRYFVSIIVQRDATIYSFIIFLQTVLHVSDDTLIHHQEHTQSVITTSGTQFRLLHVSGR